mmetsp:Transcript_3036/g.4453  ORF Transcript_3036/g.4453 Transcript_3036/m.4453 type:complete len:311 (+) Transcript_3036:19-951(+)
MFRKSTQNLLQKKRFFNKNNTFINYKPEFNINRTFRMSTKHNISHKEADKLFQGKKHATLYSKYRPTYPDEMLNDIKKEVDNRFDNLKDVHILDVGCGTGQVTSKLDSLFPIRASLTGTDPSAAQVENAKPNKNITYKVGTAEDTGFPEKSLALVSFGQCIHWMDFENVWKEMRRVLKPNGVLAILTYNINSFQNKEAQEIAREFFNETLKGYWHPRRIYVDEDYETLPFPSDAVIETKHYDYPMKLSIADYMGFLSSWSGYNAYLKDYPDSKILDEIQEKIMKAYGTTDPNMIIDISYPMLTKFVSFKQ